MSTLVQSSSSLTSVEVTERNLQSASKIVTKQLSVLKGLEDYARRVGLKTDEIEESYEALDHQLAALKDVSAQIDAETVKHETSTKRALEKVSQLTVSSQVVLDLAEQKSSTLKLETEELERALSAVKTQMEIQRGELEKGVPVSDGSQSLRALHQQAADLAIKLSAANKELESTQAKSRGIIEAHKVGVELQEKMVSQVETTHQQTITLQSAQRATVSKCLGYKLTALAKTYSLAMKVKAAVESSEKVELVRKTVELCILKVVEILKALCLETDDEIQSLRHSIREAASSAETMTQLVFQTEEQLSGFPGLIPDESK